MIKPGLRTCAALFLVCAIGAVATAAAEEGAADDARVADGLRRLGQAIHLYAADYKGHLPAELTMTRPYLKDDALLERLKSDFAYTVAPGTRIMRIREPGRHAIVVQKIPSGQDTIHVLFADGTVRAYAPADGTAPSAPPNDAAAAAQPAAAATRPAATAPSAGIVGAWRVPAGLHVAVYQFDPDGSFTLTFEPTFQDPSHAHLKDAAAGTGQATGTWRLDGQRLVMQNQASTTTFAVAGETEEAEVTRVDANQLVLRTTDRKGQPETLTLRRIGTLAKGEFDEKKLIGTWDSRGQTLVLTESGLAVMAPSKGGWSQAGNQLALSLESTPGRAGLGMAGRKLTFTIDHVDDTTLVLTGPDPKGGQRTTTTYLRAE